MSKLVSSIKSRKCTCGFAAAVVVTLAAAPLLNHFGYFATTPIIIGSLVALSNALAWEFFVMLFLDGALRDRTQTPLVDPDDPFSGTGANKTADVPTNVPADVAGLRLFFILKVLCLVLAVGGVLVCASPQSADLRSNWVISMLFGYVLTLLLGCLAIALFRNSSANDRTYGSP